MASEREEEEKGKGKEREKRGEGGEVSLPTKGRGEEEESLPIERAWRGGERRERQGKPPNHGEDECRGGKLDNTASVQPSNLL